MQYELRTYNVAPEKMTTLVTRFQEHGVRLFQKHGMESIGYWDHVERPNEIVYLLRHTGDPAANWEGFRQDAEWQKAKTESEKNGPLIVGAESKFLEPNVVHEMSKLGQQ